MIEHIIHTGDYLFTMKDLMRYYLFILQVLLP